MGATLPESRIATSDQVQGKNPVAQIDTDLHSLLVAVAAGDAAAFESFYHHTVNRVYYLANRILASESAAEDAVSEIFLQAWRDARKFDAQRGSPMAWIMTISRTRCLDMLRRNARHTVNREEFDESTLISEVTPAMLVDGLEASSKIRKELAGLSDTQRQLLAFSYYRGFSHQEIADQTGIPLGTVKTQIRTAIGILRERMQNDLTVGERT